MTRLANRIFILSAILNKFSLNSSPKIVENIRISELNQQEENDSQGGKNFSNFYLFLSRKKTIVIKVRQHTVEKNGEKSARFVKLQSKQRELGFSIVVVNTRQIVQLSARLRENIRVLFIKIH